MAAPYVVPRVEIRRVAPHGDEGRALIAAAVAELAERYEGDQDPAVDLDDLVPPRGAFLVARLDGEAVGCGGLRVLEPGAGEIKRMYVAADRRGRGYARAVLAELERTAAAAGRRRAVLETGTRQPEAMALYAGAGYEPITGFGAYADHPASRCFERRLAP
jgi:GNAT superfamily N-acetyltransferase